MSPQEINTAIAEILDWKPTTDGGISWNADGNAIVEPPNYFGDLNLCAEFRKDIVKNKQAAQYARQLSNITEACWFENDGRSGDQDHASFIMANASAPQHCQAFLRVKGVWK